MITNLKGLIISWAEWHMIVSGWADAVAFDKAEKIPILQDTPEKYEATDFYAILAREAWYYKAGRALGRLTWGAPIIIAVILKFTGGI